MKITATTRWKGGEASAMTDIARKARPIFAKYGTEVTMGRLHTGPGVGDWLVVTRYADWAAYAKSQEGMAADSEFQALLTRTRGIAQQMDRDIVVSVDF